MVKSSRSVHSFGFTVGREYSFLSYPAFLSVLLLGHKKTSLTLSSILHYILDSNLIYGYVIADSAPPQVPSITS